MLININLKDATRLGDLNIERFLAFVEGENALLRPAAACSLVELKFGPTVLDLTRQKLTEVIEITSQLVLKRRREERCSRTRGTREGPRARYFS